ncbi:hypothetical protein EPI10_011835 [Gossypium australe]|uniref:Retrotransposon gag domain-containing protein n=1 Tax=Gossypium australe TaxID=47621 RepID=A0A5B6W8B9_9ROSI|nr:hypothetical protein EPI10_011835 [Gossypium australe]
MMESQKNMMSQLTQLLAEGIDKGKSPMDNVIESNQYSPGFTPTCVHAPPEISPQGPAISIRPQQILAGASLPMNLQDGSGSNPGHSPINPNVPDLDEVAEGEREKVELPKQLEDRCKWLEEKFKVIENADSCYGIDAKDLSLVPDLVLLYKFKMPEFEKYNWTSCPEAHITMFCRRMTRYINNDQLLIHCFQDSLVGAAAKWYNQLSRARIGLCRDLAQAFMKQYSHVTDMAPDRILFKTWKKREMRALDNTHRGGWSATKSFPNILMTGEMIKNDIKSGKIEAGESNKRTAKRKKENEGSSRKESGTTRQSNKKLQFTSIPITYKEMYQNLFDVHIVPPYYLKPMKPSYPKWYDSNAQCEYHAGITGHSIENCLAFKKLVERFINMGVVKLDGAPNVENPLPNHGNNGLNTISESPERRIKAIVVEIKTPLRVVWEEMVKKRLVVAEESQRKLMNYCEYHHEMGHKIHNCKKFRVLLQNLMNNKEIEFCEEGAEEKSICASESIAKSSKVNFPVIVISRPKSNGAGIQAAPRVIIQRPATFAYKNSKKVPWNYECNVAIPGKENAASVSKEDLDVGSHTRSGRRYDLTKGKAPMVEQKKEKLVESELPIKEPVKQEETKEFLKFLKHSEYCVVEQLHKQPASISVLALLQSSEVHRNALMKVLNETYVANNISVNKLDD